jgi:hypothetical protein
MQENQTNDGSFYEHIGYDDLITYVVYRLTVQQRATTFENIVAEAFTLFPKRFGLRGYPQWPDSAVVNKSWLRCRTDKKYITGSIKDGFKLTQRGLDVAEKVSGLLQGDNQSSKTPTVKSELRTRSGRLLRGLEQTPAFKQFLKSKNVEGIEENDLADILLTLPDSPSSRLRSNLEQFKDAARLYERADLQEFLNALEKRFAVRLRTQ